MNETFQSYSNFFGETFAKLLQSANDEEKPLGHCVVIVELSHHLRGLHFKCNYLKMDKIKEIRQELQKELHAFHDSVSMFYIMRKSIGLSWAINELSE